MPNWIEGSLKVRGRYENVKKFFLEGINDYIGIVHNEKVQKGGLATAEADYIPRNPEEYREIYENERNGRSCSIYWHSVNAIYIEDTKRAFVVGDQDVYIDERKDGTTIGTCKFQQAWGLNPDDWVELSKKYDVDIRLWGLEGGMQFGEELEVVKGTITIYEAKNYDSWTMPLPWIGG